MINLITLKFEKHRFHHFFLQLPHWLWAHRDVLMTRFIFIAFNVQMSLIFILLLSQSTCAAAVAANRRLPWARVAAPSQSLYWLLLDLGHNQRRLVIHLLQTPNKIFCWCWNGLTSIRRIFQFFQSIFQPTVNIILPMKNSILVQCNGFATMSNFYEIEKITLLIRKLSAFHVSK